MKIELEIWVIVAAASIVSLCGCSKSGSRRLEEAGSASKGPIVVYVSNYPLKYFAERIGGEHVAVHFPAPPVEDPAYWMPDTETIRNYQQAEVVFLNGAGYEKWLDAVSLPTSKLCDTSHAFVADYIALKDAMTHSHGPTGKHTHAGTAFTTWLDPILASKQAEAVRARLANVRPEHSTAFQRNFDALKTDLENLDHEIARTVAKWRDSPVLFSHPVYQYFERQYGLKAKSVHWEPDEAPTDPMWAELKKLLEVHPAKWMIWEGAPLDETIAKLNQLGVGCIVFAPCGNRPKEGDYLTAQRKNLAALGKVYAESPQGDHGGIQKPE